MQMLVADSTGVPHSETASIRLCFDLIRGTVQYTYQHAIVCCLCFFYIPPIIGTSTSVVLYIDIDKGEYVSSPISYWTTRQYQTEL